MTNKAGNSRFFGAVLLCCAAMAAGYGYYDSANGRAIAELKAKTAQMKAQNESLRRQTAAEVEQARAVLSTWGRPGRETETPLLMTGEFDVVELNKAASPWSLQLRPVNWLGDVTVTLANVADASDQAKLRQALSLSFRDGLPIKVQVTCVKGKCALKHFRVISKAAKPPLAI